MIETKLVKILILYADEVISVAVLIGGMSLQYLFGDTKGLRAFYIVVAATLLMAFITSKTMSWLEVPLDSALRDLGLAFSSITGVALISWGIKIAPPILQARLLKFFKGDS